MFANHRSNLATDKTHPPLPATAFGFVLSSSFDLTQIPRGVLKEAAPAPPVCLGRRLRKDVSPEREERVASPLHLATGASAGMSPWLGPWLHLRGDTAPSGLLSISWRLPSSVQCPSVTLSSHRTIRLPGPVGAGILSSVGQDVVPGCAEMGGDLRLRD
ncbi:hypothetical protein EVAR_80815_1 [Eumeta japonica]|uniref:Uncharacterized protein n=1 Tax=Eumeta variegata TaxID=151549 RepID=A0A4C1WG99_EUMVA|nr:hypothetical protein EVAR_80815_1 [Eumeta japonica]